MRKDYKKALEIAHETRKFEISLLWKRAWFFWGFTVAGFIGYSYFFKQPDHQKALLVANFGFISSFIWTLVNRGSKFWQDFWDERIQEIETYALGHGFFQYIKSPKNRGLWSGIRFSPSRLIIALSDYVFVAWLGIIVIQGYVLVRDVPQLSSIGILAFLVSYATTIYAIFVLIETLFHHDKTKKKSG